ncbi:MAG: FtsX-like permease family protein [Gemmatimonadota bacterium]|nr:FtsX-like permease family protein [Gemmatimonadota bacterium]
MLVAIVVGVHPGPASGQDSAVSPSGHACPSGLEVLVERGWGESARLAPGDTLEIRSAPEGVSCRAVVTGLFEPPPDPSRLNVDRPRLLFHLPHLAALAGRPNDVDQLTIALAPGADPARVAERLEPLLPGAQVLSTVDVADRSSTTFLVVNRFHGAIGLITLIAGGVFLACIMVLKVQERRAPIAAARLVGVRRGLLMGWLVSEAAILSALGGVLGLGLGLIASSLINAFYQHVYDTTLVFSRVTVEMTGQALALAVVLGLGAGLFAARRLLVLDALEEVGR